MSASPGPARTVFAATDLLEHLPCGAAVLDMDGRILFSNYTLQVLTRKSESSLLDMRFQDLLTRGGSIFYETHFGPSLMLRGSVKEVSFDLVADGSSNSDRIPILVNAALLPGKDGAPSVVHLVVFESRQRRVFETDLLRARREAEQIAEMVRRSSDAILSLTPDGLIQSWNSGAEQLFGYASDEIVGQPLSSLFDPSARAEVEEAVPQLRRGRQVGRETLGLGKSGASLEVSLSLTPHMEAPGVLVAFSAIIRDATARKVAEKALLQSEKLASVGRLASSIAHEINNPLESVTNLLYLIRTSVNMDEIQSYVVTAERELRRVALITSQTLRFHKQADSPSPVFCHDLIGESLSMYQGRLVNSNILVEKRKRAVHPVECFTGEIRQVLCNLIGNAIDAMPFGGRLVLRSREATHPGTGKRGLVLTVADTGTGMSAATRKQLFEPFFTTKGIGGTGLGLWVSAEIVKRHSGLLHLRSSQRVGHSGTVFALFLPFDAAGRSTETVSQADRLQ